MLLKKASCVAKPETAGREGGGGKEGRHRVSPDSTLDLLTAMCSPVACSNKVEVKANTRPSAVLLRGVGKGGRGRGEGRGGGKEGEEKRGRGRGRGREKETTQVSGGKM